MVKEYSLVLGIQEDVARRGSRKKKEPSDTSYPSRQIFAARVALKLGVLYIDPSRVGLN